MRTLISDAERVALETRLRHLSSGQVKVTAVEIEERQEPGDDYVLVSVRLSPPNGESWPADDFYAIRRDARRLATDALGDRELKLSYHVDEPHGPSADEDREGPGTKPSEAR